MRKFGKEQQGLRRLPAATIVTEMPPRSSPAQRLLPCLFQVGEPGPDDPFPRTAGNPQPRLPDGLADALDRRIGSEALSKSLHVIRCNLHDEARGRLGEQPN